MMNGTDLAVLYHGTAELVNRHTEQEQKNNNNEQQNGHQNI
jgi:hypothetical protein